ncbi:MAG: hypothetical protein ACSNEK_05000 [Parachlamydiaceae bacterium]
MKKISFFTPLMGTSQSQPKWIRATEIVDSYFYLGGRKARIVSLNGSHLKTEWITSQTPVGIVALKVASYCTILLPMLFFVAKAVLRSRYKIINDSGDGKASQTPSLFSTLDHPPNRKLIKDVFEIEKQQFRLQLLNDTLEELTINSFEEAECFLRQMIGETAKTDEQITIIFLEGSLQTLTSILKESLLSQLLEFNPSQSSNLFGIRRKIC